jgi:hypothetical protein
MPSTSRLTVDVPLVPNSFVWVRRNGQWLEAGT